MIEENKQEMEKYVVNDVNKVCADYDISRSDLMRILLNDKNRVTLDNYKKIIDHNAKKLVGRCFRRRIDEDLLIEAYQYIQVISAMSSSIYSVSCQVFTDYPAYDFITNMHFCVGDELRGHFEMESIGVEDFHPDEIKLSFEEISIDDYIKAMDVYIKRLQNMKWYTNRNEIDKELIRVTKETLGNGVNSITID